MGSPWRLQTSSKQPGLNSLPAWVLAAAGLDTPRVPSHPGDSDHGRMLASEHELEMEAYK